MALFGPDGQIEDEERAKRYRDRAEELRRIAESYHSKEAAELLIRGAEGYEYLSKVYEPTN